MLKKILIGIGIFIGILLIAGVLFISYVKKSPEVQLAVEQARNENFLSALEERYPDLQNYSDYIPATFNDGLSWDDVTQRGNKTDFRTVETATGQKNVSVINGFRVMYKYPDNKDWFAKMMVEQSKADQYKNDKLKVLEELQLSNDDKKIEKKTYNGYDYYLGVINLSNSPVETAIVFFPEEQIVNTIYFLNQNPDERKFQSIDEFIVLQDAFIKQLIDHKIKNSK